VKLHLGSGSFNFQGWLNVDLDAPEADMHLDLRKKLPFGNELISHIYNEHFIEHITKEESINLLKECYRVLKNGGIIRLSTPNLKSIIAAYLARNLTEWSDVSWLPNSPCDLINESMRLWGHQYLYDAEALVVVLKEAGFNSVKFVNYRESDDQEFIKIENRPFHNELIIEARKDNSVAGFSISGDKYGDNIEADLELRNQKVIALEADLELRNQKVIALEADLELRNQKVIALETDLELRDQNISNSHEHINLLITQISKIEQELTSRGQQIISLEADLASHGQHTSDLTNHINSLEAELTNLRSFWHMKIKHLIRRFYKF